MKVRKSLFAVSAVALLFGGSYLTGGERQKALGGPRLVADGTDPMPKPKPTGGRSIAGGEAASRVMVADGTDPMPKPKPTRGTSIGADVTAPSVLVADGTDPMPKPPRKLA